MNTTEQGAEVERGQRRQRIRLPTSRPLCYIVRQIMDHRLTCDAATTEQLLHMWNPVRAIIAAFALCSSLPVHAQTLILESKKDGVRGASYLGQSAKWLVDLKGGPHDLYRHPKIEQLALNNHVVSRAELNYVCGLPNLKELLVGVAPEGVELAPTALAEIAKARNSLEWLEICKPAFRDADLQFLPKLHRLTVLRLQGRIPDGRELDELSKVAAEYIAGCESIERVELRDFLFRPGHGIGVDFVAALAEAKTLRELRIYDCHFTSLSDKVFEIIGEEMALKSLEIVSPEFTDGGVAKLRDCKTLEHVTVESPKLTRASIEKLKAMPNIKRIVLRIGEQGIYTREQHKWEAEQDEEADAG